MKWGIVTTVKADTRSIAEFAAHHLELGADRLYIYLDDDSEDAYELLKTHPKIRVLRTTGAHWRSANRPEKHQARQSANARHAYRRKAGDVDWLAHIDVDEFLWPETSISEQLEALPEACQAARVRPIEALAADSQNTAENTAGNTTYFKAMTNDRKQRLAETQAIFPTFGTQLNGGFLSHVAGKVFARTGHKNATFKIHNFYVGDDENPGQVELLGTKLCHMHAHSFDAWMAAYRYRLSKGAYRAELKPNRPREQGGLSLHELLTYLEQTEGEDGLRAFYTEVCTATPELRAQLDDFGLLYSLNLDLAAKCRKHFPTLGE